MTDNQEQMPARIQRRRTKGWKMPEGAVYVGRPGPFGNPFVADDWQASFRAVALGFHGDKRGRAEAATFLYRLWITCDKKKISDDTRSWFDREVMTVKIEQAQPTADQIKSLRGKSLACWCAPDGPCHADVLLEIANAGNPVNNPV